MWRRNSLRLRPSGLSPGAGPGGNITADGISSPHRLPLQEQSTQSVTTSSSYSLTDIHNFKHLADDIPSSFHLHRLKAAHVQRNLAAHHTDPDTVVGLPPTDEAIPKLVRAPGEIPKLVRAPPKPAPNPRNSFFSYSNNTSAQSKGLSPDCPSLKLDLMGGDSGHCGGGITGPLTLDLKLGLDANGKPSGGSVGAEGEKGDGDDDDEYDGKDPSIATKLVDKLHDLKLQGYWLSALKLWEKNVIDSGSKLAWPWKSFHYQLLHDLLTEAGKFDEVRRVWNYQVTRSPVPIDELSANGLVKNLATKGGGDLSSQGIRLQLLEEVLAYMADEKLNLSVIGLTGVQIAHTMSPGSWDKALSSLVDVAVLSRKKWDNYSGLSIQAVNNLVLTKLQTEHDVACTLAYLTAKEQCERFPTQVSGVLGQAKETSLLDTMRKDSNEIVTILPNEISYACRISKMKGDQWLEALDMFNNIRLMRTEGGMYPPGQEMEVENEDGSVETELQVQPEPVEADKGAFLFTRTMKLLRFHGKFQQHLAFRVFEQMVGSHWPWKTLTVNQRKLIKEERRSKANVNAALTATELGRLNDILGLGTPSVSPPEGEKEEMDEESKNKSVNVDGGNVVEVPPAGADASADKGMPTPVYKRRDNRGLSAISRKETDGFDPTEPTDLESDPPGTFRATPDTATLDHLIGIYEYQGRWKEVLKTMDYFKTHYPGANSTNKTFTAHVNAMGKSGLQHPDSGKQLMSVFEDMTMKGYRGTTQSDIAAIDAWSKMKRKRF